MEAEIERLADLVLHLRLQQPPQQLLLQLWAPEQPTTEEAAAVEHLVVWEDCWDVVDLWRERRTWRLAETVDMVGAGEEEAGEDVDLDDGKQLPQPQLQPLLHVTPVSDRPPPPPQQPPMMMM